MTLRTLLPPGCNVTFEVKTTFPNATIHKDPSIILPRGPMRHITLVLHPEYIGYKSYLWLETTYFLDIGALDYERLESYRTLTNEELVKT